MPYLRDTTLEIVLILNHIEATPIHSIEPSLNCRNHPINSMLPRCGLLSLEFSVFGRSAPGVREQPFVGQRRFERLTAIQLDQNVPDP